MGEIAKKGATRKADGLREDVELVKMATLAERSGVPAATIKHYIREGLLPPPEVRTSRNMAYYDAAILPRIRSIKELQREHFLPLKTIKDVLDGHAEAPDRGRAATAIATALRKMAPKSRRTHAELVLAGVPSSELALFQRMGLVTPVKRGGVEHYEGDDLELLRTLGAARKSGITPDMLPFTTLMPYADAVRSLVEVEVRLLRDGILPHAGKRVGKILEAATTLSERLVVLLRRKMILPTLRALATEDPSSVKRSPAAPSSTTAKKKPKRRQSV